MRDIRFAFRTLFKTPFVTAVAVLSLALGIGVNAAIYSLFDQILLRPLPVAAPEDLVNLSMPDPIRGSDSCNQSGGCDVIVSYPMFRDIEREQDVLSGFAGHRIYGVSIAMGDEPTSGEGIFVTGGYFPTLGARPLVYMPMQSRVWVGDYKGLESRRDFWVYMFGIGIDAVGKFMGRSRTGDSRTIQIVGLAPNIKYSNVKAEPQPAFYLPWMQQGVVGQMYFHSNCARTSSSTA